jgi:hypothetical protein
MNLSSRTDAFLRSALELRLLALTTSHDLIAFRRPALTRLQQWALRL